MKPFTTILLCGASALAGGVSGYFIRKKVCEKDIDKRINDAVNEELENIRKHRENAHSDASESGREETLSDDDFVYEWAREAIEQEFGDLDGFNQDRVNALTQCLANCRKIGLDEDQTDLAIKKLLAETESPEEDEDEEDGENPQVVMEDYQNEPPKVIPLDEYSSLPPYFEFLTYHYFEDDDTLTDDGDQIVDDIDRIVGDALVHFGECDPNDDDTVYVLNGSMGLAIEIERIHSAYSEWNGWGSY